MNGLPAQFDYLLIPVMQAGALAAVFAAGVLALIARRPRLAGLVVLAGGSAWVLAKMVKRVVERGRPAEYFDGVVIHGAVQMGQGFPSGHAAVIAAMATVASPYLGRTGRILVWTVVGLVALARVYTGAHLPLDVVGRGRGMGSRLRHQPGAGDAGPGPLPGVPPRLPDAGVARRQARGAGRPYGPASAGVVAAGAL